MGKLIFLVDMDAFFISCELTRHPEIMDKPAAVAGDPKKRSGIILTADYKARKFGIKTAMTLSTALKFCPDLIIIPPDHYFYEQKSREVIRILSFYTPMIQQNSIDEAWLDMTGCRKESKNPLESARHIRNRIKNELGLSCSIGISENKFLSKMASEMRKPYGITELWKKDITKKLWPLPVESIYGVGKQTADKLKSMKIKTIGDLALFNKNILTKNLGKMGLQLYELANGIDDSSIKPHLHSDIKSIGKSTTLSKDISNIEYAKGILMKLSDEIGTTARKYNKKGHIIKLSIKYYNFHTITRRTTIHPTYLVKEIYSTALTLLEKHWDRNIPIRLLGISLSGFINSAEIKQLSIFDMQETERKKNTTDKFDKIEDTISIIRKKYGFSIINRAISIGKINTK